jgi:gp16 family phage-associated protein
MTRGEVKESFEKKGKTYVEWAKENGFKYATVIAVINGVNKGRSGEAHRVAVALGLKAAV